MNKFSWLPKNVVDESEMRGSGSIVGQPE